MDAVVTLAKALGTLPHTQRNNGSIVRSAIQNTNFDGVSGRVQFDANGDIKNSLFTVMNLGQRPAPRDVDQSWTWQNVGQAGAHPSQLDIDISKICWADRGCGGSPPSELSASDALGAYVFSEFGAATLGVVILCLLLILRSLINKIGLKNWSKWNIVLTNHKGKKKTFHIMDEQLHSIDEQRLGENSSQCALHPPLSFTVMCQDVTKMTRAHHCATHQKMDDLVRAHRLGRSVSF
eukprot:COSAG01_NODE_5911_length_3959_cov_1.589896_2_plen_236_part_00